MLVNTTHKKLVLNLRHPQRVTNVIPAAQSFQYKGAELVAVPHRLEEVRVMRNLGFNAPSPIHYHYDWSGPYTPFKAQRETAAFLTVNPKAFVLNDMGTGKTLATLWAYDYLKGEGLASKMLVISPLSTLERTWADEVFQHFPHLRVSVVYGTKQRRIKMLQQDADIYLINHDGIVNTELDLKEAGFDTIVVDEIASFRNASTNRWKALNRVCRTTGVERVWGLTGTPTPNSPVDAWAQCRLICPENVPTYAGKFKEQLMKQLSQFKWVARENATDVVAQAMQPSIRFSRDECVDLPPCTYIDRAVALTPDQMKAYKEMQNSLVSEYQSQQVTAVNEAVKMQKLIQIACGVVYDTNGDDVVLPNNPRMDVVLEVIEATNTKTIVFVPFKGVLRNVADQLEKSGLRVGIISGDVSAGQRNDIFSRFQKEPLKSPLGIDVLVAQPAAMSHGLTLTAASTVIWFAPVTSNEVYQQANARITRPGQKHNQLIVNIEGSLVERKVYTRLKAKQSMQGALLDIIRDERD